MSKTIPIIPIPAAEDRPAHALLGASSSKIWLSCTPSVRAGENEPDDDTVAAQEGTFAHGLAAAKLMVKLGRDKQALNKYHAETDSLGDWTLFYNQDLEDTVQEYVDRCVEDIEAARAATPDAVIMVEEVLDFSRWVPAGFGTGDLVIVSSKSVDPETGEIIGGLLKVRDLKYGKGVHVDVVDNSQLWLYAAGAYAAYADFYDFDEIEVTIDQPRMGNIQSQRVAVKDLLKWLEEYVKPRAILAWNGEGEFVPGDWCRFCRARRRCVARKEFALSAQDFSGFELLDRDPPAADALPSLSNEEIVALIPRFKALKAWAGDMLEWVESEQVKGRVKWAGYKLVEGRSVREIKEPLKLAGELVKLGLSEGDIYHPAELKGLTDLSKLIGKKKFDTLAKPYLHKPKGKPTLAPADDPREVWTPETDPDDAFGGLD